MRKNSLYKLFASVVFFYTPYSRTYALGLCTKIDWGIRDTTGIRVSGDTLAEHIEVGRAKYRANARLKLRHFYHSICTL